MAPRGSYSSISQKRVGMVSKCAIHCASLLNNNRLCSFARIYPLPFPSSSPPCKYCACTIAKKYIPPNIRKRMCAANVSTGVIMDSTSYRLKRPKDPTGRDSMIHSRVKPVLCATITWTFFHRLCYIGTSVIHLLCVYIFGFIIERWNNYFPFFSSIIQILREIYFRLYNSHLNDVCPQANIASRINLRKGWFNLVPFIFLLII